MNFKMLEIIIEDSESIYKHYGFYENEEEVINDIRGNGEIIRIRDVSDLFPLDISKVFCALVNNGFGNIEANAIYALLNRYSNVGKKFK